MIKFLLFVFLMLAMFVGLNDVAHATHRRVVVAQPVVVGGYHSSAIVQPLAVQSCAVQQIVAQPIVTQQIVAQPIVTQQIVSQPVVQQVVMSNYAQAIVQPQFIHGHAQAVVVNRAIVQRQVFGVGGIRRVVVARPFIRAPFVRIGF